jgi:hypothetical protein
MCVALLLFFMCKINDPYSSPLIRCSKFGEILDVVADNVTRSAAWMGAYSYAPLLGPVCLCIISMEWLTFTATQIQSLQTDKHWKNRSADSQFITMCFRNNFVNPLGVTVIGGLFLCPISLYLSAAVPELATKIPLWWPLCGWFAIGRVMALYIEWGFCWGFIDYLLRQNKRS